MQLQHERRHTPYPLTFEIPAAVLGSLALLGTLGVHLGRAVANLLVGAGWTWPMPSQTFRSLPAVVEGHASAGLPSWTGPVAGAGQLWVAIVLVEVMLLAAAGWGIGSVLRRWGPQRLKGMATAAQAETVLGVGRLRRVAGVIRPDLHSKTERSADEGQRV